jgi:hypothetical protein
MADAFEAICVFQAVWCRGEPKRPKCIHGSWVRPPEMAMTGRRSYDDYGHKTYLCSVDRRIDQRAWLF